MENQCGLSLLLTWATGLQHLCHLPEAGVLFKCVTMFYTAYIWNKVFCILFMLSSFARASISNVISLFFFLLGFFCHGNYICVTRMIMGQLIIIVNCKITFIIKEWTHNGIGLTLWKNNKNSYNNKHVQKKFLFILYYRKLFSFNILSYV